MANIPICAQINIITNNEKAEKIDVQTTSCPASSSSFPISALIGALDTATGVPNKAINAGNSFPLNPMK